MAIAECLQLRLSALDKAGPDTRRPL